MKNQLSGFDLTSNMSKGRRAFLEEEARREQKLIDDAAVQFKQNATAVAEAERELACKELLSERDNSELKRRCIAYKPAQHQSEDEVFEAIHNAFVIAKSDFEKKGYQIHSPAFDKKVARVMQLNPSLDSRLLETFVSVIEYMIEVAAFTEDELVQPAVEPEPVEEEPTDQSDDAMLESINGHTHNKLLRDMVAVSVWGPDSEYSKTYDAWIASLYKLFNFSPTPQQQRMAVEYMTSRNLNLLRPQSYDEARVFLTRNGQWPEGMLLPDEQAAIEIENWDKSHPNAPPFEKRVALARIMAKARRIVPRQPLPQSACGEEPVLPMPS